MKRTIGRKWICLIAAVLMVFGLAGNVKAASFQDVPAGKYYTEAVNWAVSKGITSGTSSTTFSPGQPCTRAQIVTFLYKAAGSPKVSAANSPFIDVVSGKYYYDAVLWAVSNNITTGTSAAEFSPDRVCTRAQAMTFLWRLLNEPVVENGRTFSDVKTGDYFCEPVRWAASNGVTTGTSSTLFSPKNTCTRAQIVTFLYNALAKKTAGLSLNVKESGWYYSNECICYGVEIENPNTALTMEMPVLTVTVKDTAGKTSVWQDTVPYAAPGSSVWLSNEIRIGSTPAASVAFSVATEKYSLNKPGIIKTTALKSEEVRTEETEEGTFITGKIKNTSASGTEDVRIAVIFKKNGKIAGGISPAYTGALAAGAAAGFSAFAGNQPSSFDEVVIKAVDLTYR